MIPKFFLIIYSKKIFPIFTIVELTLHELLWLVCSNRIRSLDLYFLKNVFQYESYWFCGFRSSQILDRYCQNETTNRSWLRWKLQYLRKKSPWIIAAKPFSVNFFLSQKSTVKFTDSCILELSILPLSKISLKSKKSTFISTLILFSHLFLLTSSKILSKSHCYRCQAH